MMGGRTLPIDCRHGVTVDWGDFGPCQDCEEHDGEPCPNHVQCQRCRFELLAPAINLRRAALAVRNLIGQVPAGRGRWADWVVQELDQQADRIEVSIRPEDRSGRTE